MMLRTVWVLAVCCAVLGYTAAYKRQAGAGLTCRDVVKQEQEMPLPADYEAPKCDQFGNYRPVQCFGEWTGKGHCRCVDPLSGERFMDVKGVEAHAMMRSGGHMTCRCALDNAFEADRARICDLYTGDYTPVVCIGERCRCAERWGAPIYAFGEFKKGESNCLCARRSSDLGRRIGLSVNCNPYGQFDPVQCTGSTCFCVDRDGNKIGQSVFIGEAGKLKC